MKNYLIAAVAALFLYSCVSPNPGPDPGPTPVPTQHTKTLQVVTIPGPTGAIQDYKVKNNVGYILMKDRNRLDLYTFNGSSVTSQEIVTNNCDSNSQFFMLPVVAATDTYVYVAWGKSSRRNNPITLMKRPIAGGEWTTSFVMPDFNFEQFNMEGLNNDLVFCAFYLNGEKMILWKNANQIIDKEIRAVSKRIRTYSTPTSVSFYGRFKKIVAIRYDGLAHSVVMFNNYIAEPSGMELPGSFLAAGWTGFIQEGTVFYPTNLVLDNPLSQTVLKTIGRSEALSVVDQSGVFSMNGKLYVVFDLSGNLYMMDTATKKETKLGSGGLSFTYNANAERADIVTSGVIYSVQMK